MDKIPSSAKGSGDDIPDWLLKELLSAGISKSRVREWEVKNLDQRINDPRLTRLEVTISLMPVIPETVKIDIIASTEDVEQQ